MRSLAFALLLAPVAAAQAAESNAVPPPPVASPAGIVRVWGNAQVSALVKRWSDDFADAHPNLRIEARLTGSDIGMAALYTGRADVAILGRRATASELQAFEWVYRFKPSAVEIMNGSLDRAGRSPALVVFVHRENPLASVTLSQLDAIFGTEHRNSPAPLRTWGAMGLVDPWSRQPLRLYGPMAESGTGRFFRQEVLGDSNRMNWEQLTEFDDPVVPGPHVDDSGRAILAALAADRYGMALGNLDFARPEVKALALQLPGGEPVPATRTSVRERTYPLARVVYAYYRRPPTGLPDGQVLEFLQHVVSDKGQAAIQPADGYLPLTGAQIAVQRAALD